MSEVPKSRRSESKVLFLENIHVLFNEFMNLLERDFGAKKNVMTLDFFVKKYGIDSTDMEILSQIRDKYMMNASFVKASRPDWIVNEFKIVFFNIFHELFKEVTMGNSIYIETKKTLNKEESIGTMQLEFVMIFY